MTLSPRDGRFIYRSVTLLVLAGILALGILVALGNRELDKLLPPSTLRTYLMVVGPLLPLAITNYTMARGASAYRGLAMELAVVVAAYAAFLALVLPTAFPVQPVSGCIPTVWRSCPEIPPDPNTDLAFAAGAVCAAALAFLSWRIVRGAPRGRPDDA